jgi:diadenosine tetraphosphate (Ap4A) HIT family hydrolase
MNKKISSKYKIYTGMKIIYNIKNYLVFLDLYKITKGTLSLISYHNFRNK